MEMNNTKSPIVGISAWGKQYCQKLIDWHLPSLLMAELECFGPDLKMIIYTNKESSEDIGHLSSDPFYKVLNIEVIVIPEDIFNYNEKSPNQMKKICQYELVNRAWGEDRPLIYTYPDAIYSPGTFRAFKKAVDDGYRAISVGIFAARIQSHAGSDEFREALFGSVEPTLRWTAKFLDYLHPWVTTRLWSGRHGNVLRSNWPCYLYADEEPGLFANIFHPHPVYVHPRQQVTWTHHGFEGDLLEHAGIPFEECLLIADGSAVAIAMEYDGRDPDVPGFPALSTGVVSDDEIAAWARRHTMPMPYYQRRFFPITIPLALRDGYSLADCAGTIQALTERAKNIVRKI